MFHHLNTSQKLSPASNLNNIYSTVKIKNIIQLFNFFNGFHNFDSISNENKRS